VITDQISHQLSVSKEINRIVSLVPSQTEFLFSIGLEEKIKGVTLFCDFPKQAKKIAQIVGGTKKLNLALIRKLNPCLIVANKEENSKQDIEALQKEFPVWTSDISSIDDAFEMMESLGKILKEQKRVESMLSNIKESFKSIKKVNKTAVYLIWNNPIMVAGKDTFISKMMKLAGLKNLILNSRYPEISKEELACLKPDFILLSSEPFPFKTKHLNEFKLANSSPLLVDGTYFSWYGSRLSGFSNYIEQEFR